MQQITMDGWTGLGELQAMGGGHFIPPFPTHNILHARMHVRSGKATAAAGEIVKAQRARPPIEQSACP